MSGTGVTPNNIDPETHGPAWYIVSYPLLALAVAAVAARLWSRCVILKNHGLDDLLITLALFVRCGCFALTYLMVSKWYWNHHTIDVPPAAYPNSFRAIWILHELMAPQYLFIKTSILAFFLRVLSRAQYRTIFWIIIGTIVFVIAYTLTDIFWYTFNCTPVEASWMLYDVSWATTHKFKCGDIPAVALATAIFNCVTDYWITVLPLFFIKSLNLHRNQKRALFFVFGLGFLACAASTCRVYITHILLYDRLADVFWAGYNLLIWGEVEADIAIICACAPTLKVYAAYFSRDFKASRYYTPGGLSGSRPVGRADATKEKTVWSLPTTTAVEDDSSERNIVELNPMSPTHQSPQPWQVLKSASAGVE